MRRTFMDKLESEEGLDKASTLAKTPRVKQALVEVRRVAQISLNTDVPFRWWLLAAGAVALDPWEARYAGHLYVRLGRYQARRLLKGGEEREIRLLLQALAEFLLAHETDPEMLHFWMPDDRELGKHEEG
jgi:hypothetical protein